MFTEDINLVHGALMRNSESDERDAWYRIRKELGVFKNTTTNTGSLEIKLPNRGAFILCANECGVKASVASKLLNAILLRASA